MDDGDFSALVQESLQIPVHWDTRSAEGALVMVRREMQRRHPDLNGETLERIVDRFDPTGS